MSDLIGAMTLRPCAHEKEVADLLMRGHYPQACTPELRAHVSDCRTCSDLVLVTSAFQAARSSSTAAASLPSPGQLWWRAQLRRRNAAVERIGKPILGAQIFALSVTVIFAIGFLATQATHGLHWLSWFNGLSWPSQMPQAPAIRWDALHPTTLFSSGMSLLVLIPILAILALLGGVAVYFASEKSSEKDPR
jgi:hypothetical protein